MEELVRRLNDIPNSYFAFVAGIVAYARKKPECLQKVLCYLNDTPNLTTSDVIKFVSIQSDFYEDNLNLKQEMAN